MKEFVTINPYNGEILETFPLHTSDQVDQILHSSAEAFITWRSVSFKERGEVLIKAARLLRENKQIYAESITRDMGKPISESYAEIEKCAWVCEYYATHTEQFLQDEKIITDADNSYVTYQPLGVILAIMPWNYPFWQVFRFAAPALMAGNSCVLKHAPNVLGCARHVETLWRQAGLPEGVFQQLIIDVSDVGRVIEHGSVKAVTLTGSEAAGSSVAAIAGRNIKKTVLELGGNNAFVVLKDADLEEAARMAVQSRMGNNGQSCIAAKRFIVVNEVAEKFTELVLHYVQRLNVGDPMNDTTQISVLARTDLAEKLEHQLQATIQQGATLLVGGIRKNTYFAPTVITNVRPGMPAFDEELFGPVAPIIIADSETHALQLANQSHYGLGVTVCTKSTSAARRFIGQSEDGAVFINAVVKSDPRLPFGGTKRSGYGRELSHHGIKEFVNIKTIYIDNLKDYDTSNH